MAAAPQKTGFAACSSAKQTPYYSWYAIAPQHHEREGRNAFLPPLWSGQYHADK